MQLYRVLGYVLFNLFRLHCFCLSCEPCTLCDVPLLLHVRRAALVPNICPRQAGGRWILE